MAKNPVSSMLILFVLSSAVAVLAGFALYNPYFLFSFDSTNMYLHGQDYRVSGPDGLVTRPYTSTRLNDTSTVMAVVWVLTGLLLALAILTAILSLVGMVLACKGSVQWAGVKGMYNWPVKILTMCMMLTTLSAILILLALKHTKVSDDIVAVGSNGARSCDQGFSCGNFWSNSTGFGGSNVYQRPDWSWFMLLPAFLSLGAFALPLVRGPLLGRYSAEELEHRLGESELIGDDLHTPRYYDVVVDKRGMRQLQGVVVKEADARRPLAGAGQEGHRGASMVPVMGAAMVPVEGAEFKARPEGVVSPSHGSGSGVGPSSFQRQPLTPTQRQAAPVMGVQGLLPGDRDRQLDKERQDREREQERERERERVERERRGPPQPLPLPEQALSRTRSPLDQGRPPVQQLGQRG